jgi:hypothetical protein
MKKKLKKFSFVYLSELQIKQMIFNHILQEFSEEEYLQNIPADDEISQIIRYEKQKLATEKAEIVDPLTYEFSDEGNS